MSCEQMMQFPAGTTMGRQSLLATSDPYVFTEPPSIQTLQLHKATTSKGYSKSSPATPRAPAHRHNVNESLKKKLGIAHIKVPVHTPYPQSSTGGNSPSSVPSTALMLSGARNSPSTPTTTTKRATPSSGSRRQSEPVESLLTTPEANNSNKKSTAGRESRGPRGKYNKREPKKAATVTPITPATYTTSSSFSNHIQEPIDLPVGLPIHDGNSLTAFHLRHWYLPEFSDAVPCPDTPPMTMNAGASAAPLVIELSRDERLELKRSELRRRSIQLRNAQKYREIFPARRRFLLVQSTLLQEAAGEGGVQGFPLKLGGNNFSKELRVCHVDSCESEALIFTAFCRVHITESADQQLFAPCSMTLADNLQCSRVPVFDVSHEVPLCEEHASERRGRLGERNGGGKQSQVMVGGGSQKKKKQSVAAVRPKKEKRPAIKQAPAPTVPQKSSAMPSKMHLTPVPKQQATKRANAQVHHPVDTVPVAKVQQQRTKQLPQQQQNKKVNAEMLQRFTKNVVQKPQQNLPAHSVVMMMMQDEHDDFVDEDDSVGLDEEEEVDSLLSRNSTSSSSYEVVMKRRRMLPKESGGGGVGGAGRMVGFAGNQTDLLLVSENSSAYESSEDTGVGGLSESEMIEEIGFDSQFLEDPEFDNVLEDLLAVEQHGEIFESMSVDDDVKTMDMTGTSTFLGDFLADQMLRDSGAAMQNLAVATSSVAHHRRGGAANVNQLIQA